MSNAETRKGRKPMKRHYTGNHSKRFWTRVNKLPRNQHGEAAYMLGVVLQEVEERALKFLEFAEARMAAGRLERGK